MAPRSAQPFHAPSIARVAGDGPKGVDHIVGRHLAKPMERGATVVDHNPRVFALLHQPGNELTHALAAPEENLCVVPVFFKDLIPSCVQVDVAWGLVPVRTSKRPQGAILL